VYLDPRGQWTVPRGPNCVCRGESGANFDPELFVSGPQPVARGVARSRVRTKQCILLQSVTKFISGQPFVKRFALCYRTVVLSCLSCPVCLSWFSVTLVYCGQTVGPMKLGMWIDLEALATLC